MQIIATTNKFCPMCMETHDVNTVRLPETTVFKNVEVHYEATYEYCAKCEEYASTEEMLSSNDIALKSAYRQEVGLLTPAEIMALRQQYAISQSDFCKILGWGAKTIARYETHQVQTAAHDSVLRKIAADPGWFMQLLCHAKAVFPQSTFRKYYARAAELYALHQDDYLRKSIEAQYACYSLNADTCGSTPLNLDKAIEAIRYFACSDKVTNLYKVKTMKMLWYADALSYKRHGHALTGLVYRALPMGAVPIAHGALTALNGVKVEEIDCNDQVAYRFLPTENPTYPHLTADDISILDAVIAELGRYSTRRIVDRMHQETAYQQTSPNAIIVYSLTQDLSLD